MNEKDNLSVNISQSKNELLITDNHLDNNLPNPQIVEVNRHQGLLEVLRQIADNTSRRRNEAGDSVSLCVMFLIDLFFMYMGICFYRDSSYYFIAQRRTYKYYK